MTHNEYQINYHIERARKRQKREEERIRAIAKGGITIIGIIILVVLLTALCKPRPYTEDTVIVQRGTDTATLWNIAAEYGPNDMSIDDYIAIIKKDNGLTSNTIYPGDVLTIRVYEEK